MNESMNTHVAFILHTSIGECCLAAFSRTKEEARNKTLSLTKQGIERQVPGIPPLNSPIVVLDLGDLLGLPQTEDVTESLGERIIESLRENGITDPPSMIFWRTSIIKELLDVPKRIKKMIAERN